MKKSKTVFNKIAVAYFSVSRKTMRIRNFLSVFLSKINFRDLELFLNKDQRRAKEG